MRLVTTSSISIIHGIALGVLMRIAHNVKAQRKSVDEIPVASSLAFALLAIIGGRVWEIKSLQSRIIGGTSTAAHGA